MLFLGQTLKCYFSNKPHWRNIVFQPGQLRYEAEMMDLKQVSSARFITKWLKSPHHVWADCLQLCQSLWGWGNLPHHHRHLGLWGLSLKILHYSRDQLSFLPSAWALGLGTCSPHTQLSMQPPLPSGSHLEQWNLCGAPSQKILGTCSLI